MKQRNQYRNENLFKLFLDAEFEYEQTIERLYKEIREFENMHELLFNEFDRITEICGYSLDQIIPTKLNNATKSNFSRVFYGYIREQYTNQKDINIPMDIINAIIGFYPITIYNVENETSDSSDLSDYNLDYNEQNQQVTVEETHVYEDNEKYRIQLKCFTEICIRNYWMQRLNIKRKLRY
eukprot:440329_1